MTDPLNGLPERLIQLVPRFRPDVDGLGECALNLGNALCEFHGIPSHFIVVRPPRPEQELDTPAAASHTVTRLSGPSAAALSRELDRELAATTKPPVLLLHYVGYGYSRQGTPLWLPVALERFRRRGGRVVILFHELYAHGRFPSKTFFTSIVQRRIFRRLLALSAAAFTSTEVFLAQMRAVNSANCPMSLIGICSNVGEPARLSPLVERKRRLAVFGRFATRRHLYDRQGAALLAIVRHLGIEEVADIGPVDSADQSRRMIERLGPELGAMVRTYGALAPEAVSALLADSLLGAVANPYSLAGKSGVIAACQAHATGVLLFPYGDEVELREPGSWALSADELLALPAGSQSLLARLQLAADAGHRHYREFRSGRAMAETLLPALTANGTIGTTP